MRIVFACLMCGLITISQALAISGGPFDGNGGQVSVTGTYAGVFIVDLDQCPPGVDPDTCRDSLALFTLSVPRTGLAQGTSAVFRRGLFYPGTIQASADPGTGKVTGIINAEFDVTDVETSTAKSISARFNANGKFDHAKVTATSGLSGIRLRGKASITYTCVCSDLSSCAPCEEANANSGGAIIYKIVGFKQSEIGG